MKTYPPGPQGDEFGWWIGEEHCMLKALANSVSLFSDLPSISIL
jgi:hypothetical protein